MSKTRDTGFLGNVVKVDASGNVSFVSGSTTLATINTTGQLSGSSPVLSASYASNAETLDGLDSTVFTLTSSFNAQTASFTAFTASINAQTASINAFSASQNSFTASILAQTSSLNTFSASVLTYQTNLNLKTASFATTGSNNFTAVQHIADTTNPTGFDTTASLYTEGGLGIKKDTYISSSLYIKGNLTVFGTQSVNYITSSQLNISTNIITVNTSTPSIRFGGLAVQDSGSAGGLTGSLLWDSQNNSWLYNNPSGSGNYDSSLVIMGPRNSSTLGNEVGLSCNYLIQGHGHHHTTSSAIFHDGSTTCIGTGMSITSAGASCFANNVCALNLVSRCNIRVGVDGGYAVISGPTTGAAISLGSNSSTFDRNLSLGIVGGDLSFSPILTINAQTGNVGIGDCTPDRRLYVADTSVTQGTLLAYNRCSTFCGTVIEGITDRTSNSGFNLMNLKSSTTSMFLVRGDGNIGIGTIDPLDKLMICGVDSGLYISNSSRSRLNLQTCGCGSWQFETNNTGGNQPGGALGITEAGVGSKFHIAKGGVACFQNTVCAPSFIGGTIKGTTGLLSSGFTPYTYNDQFEIQNEGAWRLRFQAYHNGAGYDYRVVQNNNGSDICVMTFICGRITVNQAATFNNNVGIGTTPSYKLDVYRGSSGVVLNLQGVDAYDAETGILFTSARAKISGFLNSAGGTPGSSLRFYTMPDGGSVTERLRINSDGIACFSSNICAANASIGCVNSYNGVITSNGIITKSIGGTMQGDTATYFDFPTWDDSGQGQMFEIKAFFDHFYNWGYGAHYYVYLTAREGNTQALTMFSCPTGNGGSWMAYKTSPTNLRVCKVAGTYGGGGAYWIQVTAKQP